MRSAPGTLLHVARDDRRLDALERSLAFFAPQVRVVSIPGLGHGALRPRGPQRRHRGQAHRGARQVELEHAQAPHRGADDGQCHPAARAAARIPEARDQADRAGPAHRHGPAHAAARPHGLPAQRHRHGARRIRGARRHPRSLPAGPRDACAPRLLRRYAGDDQGLRGADAADDEARAEARAAAGERGRIRRGGGEAVPQPLRGAVWRRDRRRSALRGRQRRAALPGPGALAAAVPRPPGDAVRLSAGRARELRSPRRRGGDGPLRADCRALRRAACLARAAILRRAALQAGATRAHVSSTTNRGPRR